MKTLSPLTIQQARAAAAAANRPLIEVLEEQSGLTPPAFIAALSDTLGYPHLSMDRLHAMTALFDRIPFGEAQARECLLVRDEEGQALLVLGNPFNTTVVTWAEARLRSSPRVCIAHRNDVRVWLASHEESLRAIDTALSDTARTQSGAKPTEDLSLQSIASDASPIVRLVHSMLYDALKAGASDIHLESATAGLTIKYRVDGVLLEMGKVAALEQAERIISRIKVMSELDIAERRVPQDGRFRIAVRGRDIDFRVSIMPSIHGEDAVLRILDKQALTEHFKGLRLDVLGFDDEAVEQIRRLASEPYGMLLVTGPTGSGKTTTLYSAISEINNGEDKIVTIEDPVEYQLPGVLQIPVNEKKGLTFARGLRSILRHDPDKIMVGEIRDPETAQIAIQSALTGHLVLTTVHANNVFDVLGRFVHMGVDPYSFVSALNGVLAQRLIRVNCRHCIRPAAPDPASIASLGVAADELRAFSFHAGQGCGQCRGSGFKGRKAIAEVLRLTDEIRELIASRAPIRNIKDTARANGMRTLRDAAVALVRSGETTIKEINRVTFAG